MDTQVSSLRVHCPADYGNVLLNADILDRNSFYYHCADGALITQRAGNKDKLTGISEDNGKKPMPLSIWTFINLRDGPISHILFL